MHLPFWMGSGAVVLAVVVLLTARREVEATDGTAGHPTSERTVEERDLEATAVTVGDA